MRQLSFYMYSNDIVSSLPAHIDMPKKAVDIPGGFRVCFLISTNPISDLSDVI